jgi:uncharacterized protein YxeA
MGSKKLLSKILIFFVFSMIFLNIFASSNSVYGSSSYYIKNSKKPKYLYVVDQDNMTNAENTMIVTLQGLVSNRSTSQIYT